MDLPGVDMSAIYGMDESQVVSKHRELYERAGAVGLTLKTCGGLFQFNIKGANGLINIRKLSEVELFIRGYELGYKDGMIKD